MGLLSPSPFAHRVEQLLIAIDPGLMSETLSANQQLPKQLGPQDVHVVGDGQGHSAAPVGVVVAHQAGSVMQERVRGQLVV